MTDRIDGSHNAGTGDRNYRVNMGTILADWPALVLWLAVAVAGVIAYPHLPLRVPSHWNVQGQVDAYSSRTWAVTFMPLLIVGMYLLMLVLPLIDPRRANYATFRGSYRVIRLALVIMMSGIQAITLLAALGHPVRVDIVVPAAVSLLSIVLGDVLGQVRHNYFVGIRTPWTLADDVVWRRTHRVGGYAFVAAGFLGLVGLPFPPLARMAVFLAGVLGATLFAVVYSYWAFVDEQNKKAG